MENTTAATSFTLAIVTPGGEIFRGDIQALRVPGAAGSFGVLAGHAPLVSTLAPGVLEVTTADKHQRYAVTGGLAEVQPTQVTILADDITPADALNLGQITAALATVSAEIDALLQAGDHGVKLQQAQQRKTALEVQLSLVA